MSLAWFQSTNRHCGYLFYFFSIDCDFRLQSKVLWFLVVVVLPFITVHFFLQIAGTGMLCIVVYGFGSITFETLSTLRYNTLHIVVFADMSTSFGDNILETIGAYIMSTSWQVICYWCFRGSRLRTSLWRVGNTSNGDCIWRFGFFYCDVGVLFNYMTVGLLFFSRSFLYFLVTTALAVGSA